MSQLLSAAVRLASCARRATRVARHPVASRPGRAGPRAWGGSEAIAAVVCNGDLEAVTTLPTEVATVSDPVEIVRVRDLARGGVVARIGRAATGERLGGFVYGTIVALAVIVAAAKAYPDEPGRVAAVVVITTVVFWLAHVVLAWARTQRQPRRASVAQRATEHRPA